MGRRPGRKLATAVLLLVLGFLMGAWRSGGSHHHHHQQVPGVDSSTHWFGSSLQWHALVPSPCTPGGWWWWGLDVPARCRDPPRHAALDEPVLAQQIPVFDRWHNQVGMRTQWDVHTLGLWHDSAAVLIFDASRVLLQQRSANDWTYPGTWDASVAKTIQSEELPASAATRGVLDALGIDIRLEDTSEEADLGDRDGAMMQYAASKPVCWAGRMPQMVLADCEIVHFFVARDAVENVASLELHAVTGVSRFPLSQSSPHTTLISPRGEQSYRHCGG